MRACSVRLLAKLGCSARARRAAALGSIVLLATCSSPSEPPTTPGGDGDDPPSSPQTLVLTLPDNNTILLHAFTLATVTVRRADGLEVTPPTDSLIFSTSDAAVFAVTPQGAVVGRNRGTATLTVTYGSLSARLAVTVRARLAVGFGQTPASEPFRLAVGDTLPLTATFVDADGVPVAGVPAATWSSSNPDAVSVDQAGRITALQPGVVSVSASTPVEGAASAAVVVDTLQAGLPATVRFVNGAPGIGPVTFLPNRGDLVRLSPGESVERAVKSGFFYVTLDGGKGQPDTLVTALIHPGDYVSLFAVGDVSLYLDALWRPSGVAADSGMVQVVQSSSFLVVDFLAPGAPAGDPPELCYFDPGLASGYYNLAPGRFDLLLQRKYAEADSVRLRADAPAGRPMTLVLTGSTAETASYLAFPDR